MKTDILASISNGIKSPAQVGMREWCEQNIVIPIETGTPWAGRYSTANTPWVKGWYDIIADPHTRLFAVMKGAQIGFTQTAMNSMFYWECQDPGACLYVMDSLDQARDTSRLRLQPIVRASPTIEAELCDAEAKDAMMNVLYLFRRSFVRFIGANSAGKASSFTYRYLVLEEPEKYPTLTGGEGDVIENLLKRCVRVWNSLVLIGCTPTKKGGFIDRYVNFGDMMRYMLPCPKCGMRQSLEWKQVKFDSELSPMEAGRGAWYECANAECRHHWTDADKRLAVDVGEWKPTQAAKQTGYRSALISGLYPKDDSASVRALVEAFLTCKRDDDSFNAGSLQVFVNSTLGELWEEPPVRDVKRGEVFRIRDRHKYSRGTIPHDGRTFLILTVDVQDRAIPFAVWAMAHRDMYLVDHGQCAVLEDLDEMLTRPFLQRDGKEHMIEGVWIDTGYRTIEVYNWVMLAAVKVVVPVKGETGQVTSQSEPIKAQRIGQYPGGEPLPRNQSIVLRHIHPTHWHFEAAKLLDAVKLDEGETLDQALLRQPLRLHLHAGVDTEYVDEVTAEVLIEDKPDKRGAVKRFWKRRRRKNHQWDLLRYALVARYMMKDDLAALAVVPPAKAEDKAATGKPGGGAKVPAEQPWIDATGFHM